MADRKFKVGDRVRVSDGYEADDQEEIRGLEGVVVEIDDSNVGGWFELDWPYSVLLDVDVDGVGGPTPFGEHELEAVDA